MAVVWFAPWVTPWKMPNVLLAKPANARHVTQITLLSVTVVNLLTICLRLVHALPVTPFALHAWLPTAALPAQMVTLRTCNSLLPLMGINVSSAILPVQHATQLPIIVHHAYLDTSFLDGNVRHSFILGLSWPFWPLWLILIRTILHSFRYSPRGSGERIPTQLRCWAWERVRWYLRVGRRLTLRQVQMMPTQI